MSNNPPQYGPNPTAPPPIHQPYPPTSPVPPPQFYPQAPTFTTGIPHFGEMPVNMTCPHCKQNIVTHTEYDIGLMVWVVFLVLVFFTFYLFCLCFIPFFIDSLKDVRHTCPNCNAMVGKYKRL